MNERAQRDNLSGFFGGFVSGAGLAFQGLGFRVVWVLRREGFWLRDLRLDMGVSEIGVCCGIIRIRRTSIDW